MARQFSTVDADGHLEENHIDWKERLPDKYKEQSAGAASQRQRPIAHDHRRQGLAATQRSRHRRRRTRTAGRIRAVPA